MTIGVRRVLLVKLAALGDVVMASVIPDALRLRHADVELTWMCGASVAPLVRLFPGVDRVIAVDDRALLTGAPAARVRAMTEAWRAVWGERFDDIIVAHLDARYGAVVATARGPRRSLRAQHGARAPRVRGRWFGDEYARLALGDAADEGPRERRWELADVRRALPAPPPAVAREDGPADAPTVALVPGGARNALRDTPHRRWPLASYAALADRLARDGCRVVLVGDGSDGWTRPAFDGIPVIDLIGACSLVGSVAALGAVDAVVTHDTGPMHLARLVRTPTVAIFGPTDPAEFIVGGPDTAVLWGGAGLACRPCYDGKDVAPCARNRCMEDTSVDQAHSAVKRLLAGMASSAVVTS